MVYQKTKIRGDQKKMQKKKNRKQIEKNEEEREREIGWMDSTKKKGEEGGSGEGRKEERKGLFIDGLF